MHNNVYKSAQGEELIKEKYDELLRHWPIEKDEFTISTRHGKTFVIACGNVANPPLFLFHGAASNSIMWMKDVALYTKSHRVYAVDILGEPGHSEANQLPVKGKAYVEWIEDLMTALEAREAAFVGISLGAWMCLKFACANPERVTRLAILSPAGIVSRRTSFLIKSVLYSLFLGPFAKKVLYKSIMGKADIHPRMAEFLKIIHKNFKPGKSLPPKLKANELAQLYCPILLVVGGKDVFFDVNKLVVTLAKAVPQLEVNYRANSGHMLSEFSREIDRFLLTEYAPD